MSKIQSNSGYLPIQMRYIHDIHQMVQIDIYQMDIYVTVYEVHS